MGRRCRNGLQGPGPPTTPNLPEAGTLVQSWFYHMFFPDTLSFGVNEEKEGEERRGDSSRGCAPGSQLRVEMLRPGYHGFCFFIL